MKKSLFAIIASFALAGCKPIYYLPNTANVPFFSDKGEANIDIHGGIRQAEFQGSYALTKHIGVQLNSSFLLRREAENKNDSYGSFIEVGSGYFSKLSEKGVFEIYGLLGYGSMVNQFDYIQEKPDTYGKLNTNLIRFGVQPSIGLKGDYYEFALSSRFLHLNYTNISGDLIYNSRNQVTYLNNNRNNLLIEPAITVRLGTQLLKFQFQYAFSFNYTNPNFYQPKGYISGGININFR